MRSRLTNIRSLSGQEREFLSLVVAGLRDREIAERLSLSLADVQEMVAKLIKKLGVSNRLGLVLEGLRLLGQ